MQYLVQPLPNQAASSPVHGANKLRYVISNATGDATSAGDISGKVLTRLEDGQVAFRAYDEAEFDLQTWVIQWEISTGDPSGVKVSGWIYNEGKEGSAASGTLYLTKTSQGWARSHSVVIGGMEITVEEKGLRPQLAPESGENDQRWTLREVKTSDFYDRDDSVTEAMDELRGLTVSGLILSHGDYRLVPRHELAVLVPEKGLRFRDPSDSMGKRVDPQPWILSRPRRLPGGRGGEQPKPETGAVKLYEDPDQQGAELSIGPGSFRVGDLPWTPASVDVPKGLRIALFGQLNFRRSEAQKANRGPYFRKAGKGDFPAGIASLTVERVVSMYSEKDFGGKELQLPVGTHLLDPPESGSETGREKKVVGSMRIPVGMTVSLENARYRYEDRPTYQEMEVGDVKFKVPTGETHKVLEVDQVLDSLVFTEDSPDVGHWKDQATLVTVKQIGSPIPHSALRYGDKLELQLQIGAGFMDFPTKEVLEGTLVRAGDSAHDSLVSFGDELALLPDDQLKKAQETGSIEGIALPWKVYRVGASHHTSFVSAGDTIGLYDPSFKSPVPVQFLGIRTMNPKARLTFKVTLTEAAPGSEENGKRPTGAPEPKPPSEEGGDVLGFSYVDCGQKFESPISLPCTADLCGAAACYIAAGLVNVCGAAAAGIAMCGGYYAAGSVCGAAFAGVGAAGVALCGVDAAGLSVCGLDACGAAACGVDACGAAACPAAACGVAACSTDGALLELSGLEVCGVEMGGIDACPLDACAANVCGINLCPADACAADACGVDLIPVIPFI